MNYRNEYASHLGDIICRGVAADQLRSFRLFLEKLELAIRQQQQAASNHSEVLAERRALWTSKEARLKGYARLNDRRGVAAKQLMHRAEQRQTDEHASRIATARAGEDS
ncbi:MAG: flagellar export protein FliJ [Betaproteobacteria bacterium]|nr:flagellar export protein FliJ [Betaproteobacteria bacterium]